MMWFTVGLGVTAAAMSHFIFKDLLLDRHSLSSQLKQQFDSLDSRLSSLESPPPPQTPPLPNHQFFCCETKEEDVRDDESGHNKERYTFEVDDDDGEFDDLD
nr:transmembrane protein, putative [Tanacetum cinerariifolium]